jgi:hypothetical protein
MTTPPPISFSWDGEVMRPKVPRLADRFYVVGEDYRLVVLEERSAASHSHYFAALNEAWKNLPEDMAEEYPTVDHLRKRTLIRCGYRDERSIVCASKAEAQRVAAFVKPFDDYAIVVAVESVVRVYTAQSQSMRAMGKARFQESKDQVLGMVAEMVGVKVDQLKREAGRAA